MIDKPRNGPTAAQSRLRSDVSPIVRGKHSYKNNTWPKDQHYTRSGNNEISDSNSQSRPLQIQGEINEMKTSLKREWKMEAFLRFSCKLLRKKYTTF